MARIKKVDFAAAQAKVQSLESEVDRIAREKEEARRAKAELEKERLREKLRKQAERERARVRKAREEAEAKNKAHIDGMRWTVGCESEAVGLFNVAIKDNRELRGALRFIAIALKDRNPKLLKEFLDLEARAEEAEARAREERAAKRGQAVDGREDPGAEDEGGERPAGDAADVEGGEEA